MDKYFFTTHPDARLLSAVATLHAEPVLLEMVVAEADRSWKVRCLNPLPLRSLSSLSEGIDRIRIEDRNTSGASLEFGRFDVQLFIGAEMTDRFDCDICEVEPGPIHAG
jgi:hypothetical protein